MEKLAYRQVHLDFHTSGHIPGIGTRFSREKFQKALRTGCVDSITLFSKCHHGYSYHPTNAGCMHPNLDLDLLGAQIEACREINVRTPIYISAGADECSAAKHPEWLLRNSDDTLFGNRDFTFNQGFHVLCYNTSYLDLLLSQTEEVMEKYSPLALFFDISTVRPCYCARCREDILRKGKDPRDRKAVAEQGEVVYKKYVEAIAEVVRRHNRNTEIFHNAGHLTRGRRDLALGNSHLELESLPTGGWGYDHFPMSASYAMTLGIEYLGMTGKFHSSWGEFGGYKHPNALRYETALSLAFGAKCSIGDQLHPCGEPDMATYELMGKAYREVKEKEAFCDEAKNVADIAVLSQEALGRGVSEFHSKFDGDIGANRMMLEGKYLYHVIDALSELTDYKLVILPDSIRLDAELKKKLTDYLRQGGKILVSGSSGLWEEEDSFALDLGAAFAGKNKFKPGYIKPEFKTSNCDGLFVMYTDGYDISLTHAKSEAYRVNSYFNRDGGMFCSHRHTPPDLAEAGAAIAVTDNTAYISWEIFSDYAQNGSLHLKEIVVRLIDNLLGSGKTISANLPDKAITTLTRQAKNHRYVNHILFAHTSRRGTDTEVIESIVPLVDVDVSLCVEENIKRVYLAPSLEDIPFTREANTVSYRIHRVECHQMVVIEY